MSLILSKGIIVSLVSVKDIIEGLVLSRGIYAGLTTAKDVIKSLVLSESITKCLISAEDVIEDPVFSKCIIVSLISTKDITEDPVSPRVIVSVFAIKTIGSLVVIVQGIRITVVIIVRGSGSPLSSCQDSPMLSGHRRGHYVRVSSSRSSIK